MLPQQASAALLVSCSSTSKPTSPDRARRPPRNAAVVGRLCPHSATATVQVGTARHIRRPSSRWANRLYVYDPDLQQVSGQTAGRRVGGDARAGVAAARRGDRGAVRGQTRRREWSGAVRPDAERPQTRFTPTSACPSAKNALVRIEIVGFVGPADRRQLPQSRSESADPRPTSSQFSVPPDADVIGDDARQTRRASRSRRACVRSGSRNSLARDICSDRDGRSRELARAAASIRCCCGDRLEPAKRRSRDCSRIAPAPNGSAFRRCYPV